MRKIFLVVIAVVLVSILVLGGCAKPAPAPTPAPTPAPAPAPETFTLKLASSGPGSSGPGVAISWWMEQVTKRTNGRVKFEAFFSGALVKQGEQLEAVRSGLVDVVLLNMVYFPDSFPLITIGLGLPFGPYDMETQRQLWDIMFKNPAFRNNVEQYNVKLLGVIPVPDYAMAAKQPVLKIEDFKGRKVGCVGDQMPILLQAVGATPVTIGAPARYQSLQTGVIDSSIISFEAHKTFKLYEVAPQITLLKGVVTLISGDITVNGATWNKLPTDIQEIMAEAAKDAEVFNVINMNAECYLTERLTLESGGAVYGLSFQERQKWANLLPNMHAEWVKAMNAKGLPGTEIMKLYRDTLVKLGYEFPVNWPID